MAAAAAAAAAEAFRRCTAAPEAAAPAGRQSLYQRLSNSPEAEAGRAKAPARAAAAATVYVQDIPSADDETIEESGVFGRAAVERILGGKLVEERSLDGSPLRPASSRPPAGWPRPHSKRTRTLCTKAQFKS